MGTFAVRRCMLVTRTLTASACVPFHMCIYGANWRLGVGVFLFGLLDDGLAELWTLHGMHIFPIIILFSLFRLPHYIVPYDDFLCSPLK